MSNTTNTASPSNDGIQEVVISWSPIYATLSVSLAQCFALFAFFIWKRRKDAEKQSCELFEPRQFNLGHRSPPPFEEPGSCLGWARAAYRVRDDELLRNVGLDAYMFVRFLRLSARMAFFGTLLSLALVPLYATGGVRGEAAQAFNRLTLARVPARSERLWGTLAAWMAFVAFSLADIWNEWKAYAVHRCDFMARGDANETPRAYRYTIRVENIPRELRSNSQLHEYFSTIFPRQVSQVAICLNADTIHALILERQKIIVALEKAVAFTRARPDEAAPVLRIHGALCCGGGNKRVDAIQHYQDEILRLNREIDAERRKLYRLADGDEGDTNEKAVAAGAPIPEQASAADQIVSGQEDNANEEEDEVPVDGKLSTTAYITMTSLRAKQAAIQCEISGKKDNLDVFAVPEPKGVIWDNVTMPLTRQKLLTILCAAFWMVGVLFWAVPVTFVTGIANLNGILSALRLETADPDSFWYGIVAGLLPVIFLQILMTVLYKSINLAAKKIIRKKSMPEVEAYAIYWHQLFQFANLWLILIGGSLFSQLDSLISGDIAIPTVIANAMPGASLFFMNMIIVGSFGSFGMELSMLPTYGTALLKGLIQPEARRTQRMLDDAKKPPTITWGQTIPQFVFVYLVSILYMPIVPVVEAFAFLYFGGMYVVYKHQCLHVYATEFEGGGTTTWEPIFGFLVAALYISEGVFIAYLGAKECPVQAGIGFVPLIVTAAVHLSIRRNIRAPLANLSLQAAAQVDAEGGEEALPLLPAEGDDAAAAQRCFSEAIESLLYGQPDLKASMDEREPLPYRRLPEDALAAEPGVAAEGGRSGGSSRTNSYGAA